MVECSYCQFQFGYKNELNEIRHLVTKIGPSHFANNTHWKCVYLFIHLCVRVLTYDPPWRPPPTPTPNSSLHKEFNMLSVVRMQNAHILLKRRYTSCFHPSWQLLLHHARLAPSLLYFHSCNFPWRLVWASANIPWEKYSRTGPHVQIAPPVLGRPTPWELEPALPQSIAVTTLHVVK